MEADLATRGGSPARADGASTKRKLEPSGAAGVAASPSPVGAFDGGAWGCGAGMSADAADSQPKVRRRASCMEPGATGSTMKRCCSEGKIARACGTFDAASTGTQGCPVSPSMSVMHAAQGKTGSPRLPDRCWSPAVSTVEADAMRPSLDAQTRPELDQTPHAMLYAATRSPSLNFSSTPGWSPSAALRPQNGAVSPALASPLAPSAGGRIPTNSKRPWQPPRRNRNPGNLSLDMSQVDQVVPEAFEPQRRNDLAAICSKVTDFLYIGGAAAAKDKATLSQVGITHIINCAASVAPAFYPDDFAYLNLRLRDHSSQDIARHFYMVFDFIERARKLGGRIFVHCVKGISRSPTMAIAYLMWYKQIGMYQALEFVRQARPAVDPNSGFIFQLTEWEQLHLKGSIQLHRPIVFRIEVASSEVSSDEQNHGNAQPGSIGNGSRPAEQPLIVGPLLDVEEQFFHSPSDDVAALSFVIACSDYMFIWCGQAASEQQVEAAQTASELLQEFESFPSKCDLLYEGRETPAFWSLLGEAAPDEARPGSSSVL